MAASLIAAMPRAAACCNGLPEMSMRQGRCAGLLSDSREIPRRVPAEIKYARRPVLGAQENHQVFFYKAVDEMKRACARAETLAASGKALMAKICIRGMRI